MGRKDLRKNSAVIAAVAAVIAAGLTESAKSALAYWH